mmetsp:Transcript_13115/g.48667  ORF Transcript_13115/g.48667 Transcript_13115/m.48667 type:complete len:294 (-) Transcript_13115:33-914(-)
MRDPPLPEYKSGTRAPTLALLVALVAKAALFKDGELDSLTLRQAHPRVELSVLGRVSDEEDVLETGVERVSSRVPHGDDIEGTRVSLDVRHDPHPSAVTATGNHGDLSELKLQDVDDPAGVDVHLDDVVDLHQRVDVADGAAVVGADGRHLLCCDHEALHAAQLVARLRLRDAVQPEAALGIVEQAEAIAGGRHLHHIHEARREVHVRADLAVHLDLLVEADDHALLVGERVLQAVAQDQAHRQALPQLVRAGGRPRRVDAVHLGQHPVLGRIEPLEVLLGPARHLGFRTSLT